MGLGEGARAPTPAGTRFLLASAEGWHGQAEAARGHLSAVAASMHLMLLYQGTGLQMETIAPEMGKACPGRAAVPASPPHRCGVGRGIRG